MKLRPTVLVMRIYFRLKEGEASIKDLQEEFSISRRTVYNHLRSIEDAGVHLLQLQDNPWQPARWTTAY